jgi:hypothetical protein
MTPDMPRKRTDGKYEGSSDISAQGGKKPILVDEDRDGGCGKGT